VGDHRQKGWSTTRGRSVAQVWSPARGRPPRRQGDPQQHGANAEKHQQLRRRATFLPPSPPWKKDPLLFLSPHPPPPPGCPPPLPLARPRPPREQPLPLFTRREPSRPRPPRRGRMLGGVRAPALRKYSATSFQPKALGVARSPLHGIPGKSLHGSGFGSRYPRRPGIPRQKTWDFRSKFLVGHGVL